MIAENAMLSLYTRSMAKLSNLFLIFKTPQIRIWSIAIKINAVKLFCDFCLDTMTTMVNIGASLRLLNWHKLLDTIVSNIFVIPLTKADFTFISRNCRAIELCKKMLLGVFFSNRLRLFCFLTKWEMFCVFYIVGCGPLTSILHSHAR